MSQYVRLDSYLAYFAKLYTRDFLANGGSVVRAALGSDSIRGALRDRVRTEAEQQNFVFAHVDSSETRIQQLQDVFFAISEKINWNSAARRWVRRTLSERFPVDDSDLTLNGILRRDSREPFLVRQRIDELISERLLRKHSLSGEFRRAVFQLITSVLEPSAPRSDATPYVVCWLHGTIEKMTLVKPARIYRRITKNNARSMLTSLSRWLRDCGFAGLIVTIDLGALLKPPRFAVGQRYSRAALIDAYEVLRQFIDAIDEVDGLALLVLADEAFNDDDDRGTKIYRALRTRLSDDVWDPNRANALAPMVRISA